MPCAVVFDGSQVDLVFSDRQKMSGLGFSLLAIGSRAWPYPEAPIDTKSRHVRYFATKVRYYHSYAVTFGKVVL